LHLDQRRLERGSGAEPDHFPADAYTVSLGTPNADGSGGELHTVSQVVIDPDFLVTDGDGNDVSLLHLSTPSKQSPIQIAPDEPNLWAAGVMATVAGPTKKRTSKHPRHSAGSLLVLRFQ
jgi:hypothetical protein